MRVVPLTPDLVEASVRLFAECASSCYCRYWHFEGTKNDWLGRLAFSPGTNEGEHRAAVLGDEASAAGMIAVVEDRIVGWTKVTSRAALPKLRALPVYRALSLGPDHGMLSIGCMLVDPSFRRRGVARALIEAVVAKARAVGARALEAYPHRRSEALREEELWMGPCSLYESLGFQMVAGESAYPVLRLTFPEPRAPR